MVVCSRTSLVLLLLLFLAFSIMADTHTVKELCAKFEMTIQEEIIGQYNDLNQDLWALLEWSRPIKAKLQEPLQDSLDVPSLQAIINDHKLESRLPKMLQTLKKAEDFLDNFQDKLDQQRVKDMRGRMEALREYEQNIESLSDMLEQLDPGQRDKTALGQLRSVQDGLDGLLKWLDKAEKDAHIMDKGTVVKVEKEPLQECSQNCMVFQTDIDNHTPVVQNLNDSVSELMRTSEPKVAEALKDRMDEVNRRFTGVDQSVERHGVQLKDLTDKLNEFEKEVNALEDWELPLLQTLESRRFMKDELPNVQRKLTDATRQVENHQPQLAEVHKLAQELLSHPRGNTNFVQKVLDSVDSNWETLEDVMDKRNCQYKNCQAATKKYRDGHKDASCWLDNTERRVNQLQAVSKDPNAIDIQLKEVEPLRNEIVAYEPNVDTVCSLGTTLDRLVKETESQLSVVPHQRSTSVGQARRPGERLRPRMLEEHLDPSFFEEQSPILEETGEVRHRYDDLRNRLNWRHDLLELLSEYHGINNRLIDMQDWVIKMDSEINQKKPGGKDLGSLAQDMDDIKTIQTNIKTKREPIQEVITDAEVYLRVNRAKLTPDQIQNLRKRINELRCYLDQVWVVSEQIIKETETEIQCINLQQEEESNLGMSMQALQGHLEWIRTKEEELGSRQPMTEQTDPLRSQLTMHKEINEDIQNNNEQIQQICQDAQALLKVKGHKMTADNKRQLVEAVDQLKSRYDVINRNAKDSVDKLSFGHQDLKKIEEDGGEFTTWLQRAEQELTVIQRNVGSDYSALKRQTEEHQNFTYDVVTHLADLKYMNKAKQKFLVSAKTYKEFLTDFRKRVMTKKFQGNFREEPDKEHLNRILTDLTTRYESIKTDCFNHARYLQQLMDKQKLYWDKSDDTNEWLQEREETLQNLMQKPIGAKTDTIKRQIDELNIFKDVKKHRANKVKELGEDLSNAQPSVKEPVRRNTEDIIDKYDSLERQFNDRSRRLQEALAQSQSVHDNLNDLINWMDDTEKDVHKKDPMQQHMQQGELITEDITAKQMVIEECINKAESFVQHCDPFEAQLLQTKLDKLLARYNKVKDTTQEHFRQMVILKDRLADFDRLVDELEEWLLPVLEHVESKKFMEQDLPEVGNQLKTYKKERDDRCPLYNKIHEVAEELMKHPNATDISEIKTIVTNIELNWYCLNTALAKRTKHHEERTAAQKTFFAYMKDVNNWIGSQERMIGQMAAVAKDTKLLQSQIQEVKPFQKEVQNYKPKVTENARLGAIYDKMIYETEINIATRPHYRSTELDLTKPIDRRVFEEPKFIEDRDTKADHRVDDTNKRYEHLQWLISERLEDLELMLHFMEHCDGVSGLLDWANDTKTKLDHLKTTTRLKREFQTPLEEEIQELRVIVEDFASRKTPVSDVTVYAKQFLRTTKDKLTPELHDELTNIVCELRETYERLQGHSLDCLRQAEDWLAKLNKIRHKNMTLNRRIRELRRAMQALLDWATEAEKRLGSEQPMEEIINPLNRQQTEHTVLHKDIKDHQLPILEVVADVDSFLERYDEKVDQTSTLRSMQTELKTRYGVITYQSTNRKTKLTTAVHKLVKFSDDQKEFDPWLTNAEKTQQTALRNIGRDLGTLKQQSGQQRAFNKDVLGQATDLEFMKVTGLTYLDASKVYRQDLSEFRSTVLSREFNCSFNENPETQTINSSLKDHSDRYNDLKRTSARHTEFLQDLVQRHQAYQKASDIMLDWLPGAEKTMTSLVKEPIGADPISVQKQIDKVEALRNDVMFHYEDVENVKESGSEVIKVQDELKPEVAKKTDDVVRRYEALQAQIADLLNALQRALAQCVYVKEQLDMLLEWLDEAERNTRKMEKGTWIAVKQELLLQNMQEQKVNASDIDSHHPAIKTVNISAKQLIQSREPKEARQLQGKLDDINERYARVNATTLNHGKYLDSLRYKLSEFESEVEQLEDWLLPSLDQLESNELTQQDLPEFGSRLQELKRQVENHRPALSKIKQIGDELIKDTKATSHVTAILTNVDFNWKALENIITKRNKQYEDLTAFNECYGTIRKDVTYWLDNTERRLDQVKPEALDLNTIHIQLKEIRKEIIEYKPKILDSCKTGETLDTLTKEVARPVQSSPHYRSTELSEINKKKTPRKPEEPVEFLGETPTQRELGDVIKRYKDLQRRVQISLDEANVRFDQLQKENKYRMRLEGQIKEKNLQLQELLDWLMKVEQALGTEQPLSEQSQTLTKQYNQHKSLHDDIQAHQQPILKYIDNVNHLFRDNIPSTDATKLRDGQTQLNLRYNNVHTTTHNRIKKINSSIEDVNKLEADFTEFKDWLQATTQQIERSERNIGKDLQTLKTQVEDHAQFVEDINDQKGDLKFLKRSGQTFLDFAKVYRQELATFREETLQRQVTFQETPETNVIRNQLTDNNDQFDKLKVRCNTHDKTLQLAVGERLRHQRQALITLLDWVAEAVRRLGLEQPMSDEVGPLTGQTREHKVLHDDILAHQQPVAQEICGPKLLDQFSSRLPEECSKLEHLSRELKARYDNVSVETQTRQNKLQGVLSDLEKFAYKRDDTDRWIKEGMQQLQRAQKSIGTDLPTLKQQLAQQEEFNKRMVTEGADVRHLKVCGSRIIDVAKTYRKDLKDFRTSSLPPEISRTFQENPDPTWLRENLNDVTVRYNAVKTEADAFTTTMRDLVDKHEKFGERVEATEPTEQRRGPGRPRGKKKKVLLKDVHVATTSTSRPPSPSEPPTKRARTMITRSQTRSKPSQ